MKRVIRTEMRLGYARVMQFGRFDFAVEVDFKGESRRIEDRAAIAAMA